MYQKRFLQISLIVLCMALVTPSKAISGVASPNTISMAIKNEEPSEHATAMLKRLFEIKNIYRSTLSNSEKKALRKELRGMKKEMKNASGLDSRVYISVGAIIVILLLILILR